MHIETLRIAIQQYIIVSSHLYGLQNVGGGNIFLLLILCVYVTIAISQLAKLLETALRTYLQQADILNARAFSYILHIHIPILFWLQI